MKGYARRGKSSKSEARFLNQLKSDANINQAYDQACDYYRTLRRKFIGQIEEQAAHSSLRLNQQALMNIENSIALKSLGKTGKEFEKNTAIFNQLEQEIALFVEEGQGFSDFVSKLRKELETKSVTEEKEIIKIAQSLLVNNKQYSGINTIIINTTGGYTSGDLLNRYRLYFTRAILKQAGVIQTATAYRADQMAGWLHEITALKALQNSLYKTTSLGSKNVSADIILSTQDKNIPKILNEMKRIEDNMLQFQGLQGSASGVIDMQKYVNSLKINYFGAQVKLWEANLNSLSRFSGYGVGSRNELLKQLKIEAGTSNTKYISDRQAFGFFNQFQKIIYALGVNNIIWSTGEKQTWTDQFIMDMKNSNYYLTFSRDKNNELTNYVKWSQLLDAKTHKAWSKGKNS